MGYKIKKKKYCLQESNLSLFHSRSNTKNAHEFRYENKFNVFFFKQYLLSKNTVTLAQNLSLPIIISS